VGGDGQENNNCKISWSFTIDNCDIKKNPILGGIIQKNNDLIGVNMIKPKTNKKCLEVQKKDILERYKLDLGVKHRKGNTAQRYHDSAKKFLTFVKDINDNEIKGYIVYLNHRYKPNTVTSNIQGMDVFLEYLGLKELRKSIPKWTPIHRDTITLEEIIEIKQLAKRSYDFMDYLIILFIINFDCRPHEIAKAQWSWIKGNKIYFNDCKTGNSKGDITEETQRALREWEHRIKHFKRKEKDYIFFNIHGKYKGQKLSEQTWKIRELVKELSLKTVGRKITPQDLRASIISAEYSKYVDPRTIQLKARHRDEKTTMRYNHNGEKNLEEYVSGGTIFGKNIETISSSGKDKRGYINPFCTQETLLKDCEGDETNSSFSFSFSFFFFYDYPRLPFIGFHKRWLY
jgi:integrase